MLKNNFLANKKTLGGHAIMLVGYGVENGNKYWVLKVINSKFSLNFTIFINLFNLFPQNSVS